jgi:hypothetical protein
VDGIEDCDPSPRRCGSRIEEAATPLRSLSPLPALPQHELRDLQGVKGSSFQQLVTAAPER